VVVRRCESGTASAVFTMLEKPLTRFSSTERFHTPLKRGVNERAAYTFRFTEL
jgi:hypothetical protein